MTSVLAPLLLALAQPASLPLGVQQEHSAEEEQAAPRPESRVPS